MTSSQRRYKLKISTGDRLTVHLSMRPESNDLSHEGFPIGFSSLLNIIAHIPDDLFLFTFAKFIVNPFSLTGVRCPSRSLDRILAPLLYGVSFWETRCVHRCKLLPKELNFTRYTCMYKQFTSTDNATTKVYRLRETN